VGLSLIKGRNSFPIRKPLSNWQTIDLEPVSNVIGETSLVIRYGGTIVELDRVVVMKKVVAPLILGIEWLNAARTLVGAVNQKGEVTHRSREESSTPIIPESSVSVSPEEMLHVPETVNKNPHLGVEPKKSPRTRAAVEFMARSKRPDKPVFTVEDVKRKLDQIEDDDEDSSMESSGSEIRKGQSDSYDVAIGPERPEEWLGQINDIIETRERTIYRRREYLSPFKDQVIPARSRAFVSFRTPAAKDGEWYTMNAFGLAKGNEWASPSALVKAQNGIVQLPITNGGNKPLRWTKLRGKIAVVPFEGGTEVIECGKDPQVCDTLCQIEPDWYNNPEEVYEPPLDPGLTPEQVLTVRLILNKHRRLFSKKKGLTHLTEHHIDTGDAKPVSTVPSRCNRSDRKLISDLVYEMIKDDIVEPSNSCWSSRVVLAPKPNGGIRFCIDYRAVNSVSVRDVYPLKNMDDLIGSLDGATFFTSVDLESGFWQLPVALGDRPKTAFVTPDGLFQFKRLPFGLQASPPNFQRLMDRVLGGLQWEECLCYLDDILIFGTTFEEHCERLDRVLQAIGDAGLTLNPKKCIFGAQEVKFLGHIVSYEGIKPNPAKIEAIKGFPKPSNATQLRGFLGMASFFRKFVKNFADIARPLHNLLKKDADVERDWGKEHQVAMDDLKERLVTAPVLAHDDGVSQLELCTDASLKGLGAVLLLNKEGVSKPLMFISRRLNPAEEKYHVNELEFLALLWALTKLKYHLNGRTCHAKTDSSVVKWVCERKDLTKNARLARWVADLQSFDVVVKHLSGVKNVVADALSRNPVQGEPDPSDYCAILAPGNEEFLSSLAEGYERHFAALAPGYEPREIAILQHADPEIKMRVLALQNIGERPRLSTDFYKLREGILYRKNPRKGKPLLLVVPSILRKDLISECHDAPVAGHYGVEKTLARLKESYFWTDMDKSVRAYVGSCPFCQNFKARIGAKSGKLKPVSPPKQVNELLGIDHLGPLKKTAKGNQHIIASIDYLSRWVEAEAVPDTTSEKAIRFIERCILYRHGWFSRLISDQGTAFSSKEFADFATKCRFKHIMASAEHPETNGLIERVNRAIAATLAAFINLNQDDWDEKLPQAIFAINTAKQSTTQITPFELVYGRPPVLAHELAFPWPEDEAEHRDDFQRKLDKWRKVARLLIASQQKKSKAHADRFRKPDPIYKEGDLVLVFRRRRKGTKKFVDRSVGPYQVVRRVTRVTYLVEDLPDQRRSRIHRRFNAHVSQLKRYTARKEVDWIPEELTSSSNDAPEVKRDDQTETERTTDDPDFRSSGESQDTSNTTEGVSSTDYDTAYDAETEETDHSDEAPLEPPPEEVRRSSRGRILRRNRQEGVVYSFSSSEGDED